jgi:hypothetical protein
MGSTLNTNKTYGQGSAGSQQDNAGPLATRSRLLQCSTDLLSIHDGQLQCRTARQPDAAPRMDAMWRDDKMRWPP